MRPRFQNYRIATQAKFVSFPYIRRSLSGEGSITFEVLRHIQEASENKHGLQNNQWFMKNKNEPKQLLSPWHDVPLQASSDCKVKSENVISSVIEITKNTSKKMEICKETPFNPVTQDVTKDKKTGNLSLRQYVKPPKFNYGFVPQTWCCPAVESSVVGEKGLLGDGDAMDLVDLSQMRLKPILAVSDYVILGVLGLIDQGELDAKVIAMEANEAVERDIHSLNDYSRQNPGALKEIYEWFRDYKTWEGKARNEFIWGGQYQSAEVALELIQESSQQYQTLFENNQGYWMGQ